TGEARRSGARRSAEYSQLDPHYYRQSLRPDAAKPARRTVQRDDGRTVEYDEGEGGPAAGAAGVVPGVRVRHATFGSGKVIAVEGAGDRATATVFCKGVGQKKLKLKFARLRVLG